MLACHIFLDNDKDTQTLVEVIILQVLLAYGVIIFVIELRKRILFRQELSHALFEQLPAHSMDRREFEQSNCDAISANLIVYGVDNELDKEGTAEGESNIMEHDLCTRLFQCFNCICCGTILQCWVQCFGTCAIAQESREINRLLLANHNKNTIHNIDYLSYEPYSNYYPRLMNLRFNRNKNLFWHIGTLSKLSKSLFKMLLCVCIGFIILALFELTDDDFEFEFKDMGVFVLTLSQAFLILYFVHWKWNRFDLSFDAVVKYFASGFLLSTFLAFFFELFVSFIIKACLYIIIFTFFPNEMVKSSRKLQNAGEDYMEDDVSPYNDDYGRTYNESQSTEENPTSEFENNHPVLAIAMYFCNAFLVAALVEELSKYFGKKSCVFFNMYFQFLIITKLLGYAMVEHPDLIVGYNVEDDLKQQSATEISNTPEGEDQAVAVDQTNNDTESLVEYDDVSWAPGINDTENAPTCVDVVTGATISSSMSNNRSLNSIGAGITVAMVAVAIGFACCENLIYIFIYTKGTPTAEMTILFARSVFPVHPLCAAIQSIGVCKQKLEKDSSYKLGSIISMPVFIHGLFDFCLMSIGVLVNVYGEESLVVTILSFFAPVTIVITGFWFYFFQSELQVQRLNDLDSVIIADELSNVIT